MSNGLWPTLAIKCFKFESSTTSIFLDSSEQSNSKNTKHLGNKIYRHVEYRIDIVSKQKSFYRNIDIVVPYSWQSIKFFSKDFQKDKF